MTLKQRNEQMANKIIETLQEAGYTPDEMIEVIRMARKRFNQLNKAKNNNNKA